MHNGKPMRITIRFGKQDVDLMLIASQYKLRDMLKLAVRKHLNQAMETIPLPPNIRIFPISCATIYLGAEDGDIVDFMLQFPAGCRSSAVKRLLRHATAQCDLRNITSGATAAPKPKSSAKKEALPNIEQPSPVAHKQAPKIDAPVKNKLPDDDDSIFDLI